MLLNSAVRALLPSNDRNSSWIYPSTILVHSQHVLSIFDRVPKAMYINDPINSLYGVFLYGFSSNSSCASVSFNFDSTDRGVFTGLLSFMPNLFKIFCTQLLWEKCMHYTHRISKPKQYFASPRSFIANERPRVSLISASFCLSLEKIKISYIRTKLVYIKTWICSRRRKFAAFYRVRRANALAD